MDVIDYIIVIIIFAILEGVKYFLINFIGEAPSRKHERSIEEMKALKSHELQVDSYYRNISNELVSSLMGKWYLLAFDNEKMLTEDEGKNVDVIKEITNDTISYGSKKTIKILAAFQNYNYANLPIIQKDDQINENEIELNEETFIKMYLISYLISSLKEDFTGEGIDPDDLLKIKMTDYDSNKDFLLEAHKKARALLNFK